MNKSLLDSSGMENKKGQTSGLNGLVIYSLLLEHLPPPCETHPTKRGMKESVMPFNIEGHTGDWVCGLNVRLRPRGSRIGQNVF